MTTTNTPRRLAALLASLTLLACGAVPVSVATAIPPGDFDEEFAARTR